MDLTGARRFEIAPLASPLPPRIVTPLAHEIAVTKRDARLAMRARPVAARSTR
jgi:hypothetical protein